MSSKNVVSSNDVIVESSNNVIIKPTDDVFVESSDDIIVGPLWWYNLKNYDVIVRPSDVIWKMSSSDDAIDGSFNDVIVVGPLNMSSLHLSNNVIQKIMMS